MNLQKEIIETIKSDNFIELISEVGDITFENFLENDSFKDIPILGFLIKGKNIINEIQDKLFAKKILSFLKQLEGTSNQSRSKQIDMIEHDPEYKIKVGEKLLYLLNDAEDYEKSEYIGKLFKSFLEEKIEYNDFLRCVNSINRISIVDFKDFLKRGMIRSDRSTDSYLNSGLITFEFTKPQYIRGTHINGDYGIEFKTSKIGTLILTCLRDGDIYFSY
ncbi:hypothetical protein CHRY9390_03241 [Chryseobacterium aquaeductus]|uniref:Uncharacterized protein n=1 Tax=Chryseobacterium aquaeductus TaxID=2675056 RepID=A0A9N8QW51_9FLAO|nr:hypothetical protein [Chryseobacterium aquaeductus]CAA7332518.1 hypothetical protein CHRY9390_03241 [Chryseobacterium potabilaquae]CAD7816820.1 hypothetical protein CHRY9390_03241 [Chryseobacterium aquaeductus]